MKNDRGALAQPNDALLGWVDTGGRPPTISTSLTGDARDLQFLLSSGRADGRKTGLQKSLTRTASCTACPARLSSERL